MATLSQSIRIYDGMSGPLRHITRAMNIVISDFQRLQSVSNNPIDTVGLKVARQELAQATVKLDKMEQSIKQSNQAQQGFNRSLRSGADAAGNLWNKIKGVAVAAGGLFGAKQILGLSDQLTGAQARLNLMVDDGGSVEALEKKIMASANRARTYYMDTMPSVAKLGLLAGKAFNNNDEIIRFSELMSKNFIIAGASTSEQQNAMYQLNQAMASGRLQGDEYRSIIENAPLLAQSIEDYMRNVQRAQGTLKDWSSQGLLTADVIKNALFSSADEIEERFSQMPMTGAQIWSQIKNAAIEAFQPVSEQWNQLLNSREFQRDVNGVLQDLSSLSSGAVTLFGQVVNAARNLGQALKGPLQIGGKLLGGMIQNWRVILPLVTSAVLVHKGYNVVVKAQEGLETLSAAKKALKTSATIAETAATTTATGAQVGYNAALLACPLTWAVMGITAIGAALIGTSLLMKDSTSDVRKWGQSIAEETARANQQIDDNAKQEMVAAEKAKALYENFETLYGKAERTAKEIDEMRSITNQLNNIIPNLNANFDSTSRGLERLTGKLKEATNAFYDFSYAQAMQKAYQEKVDIAAKNIVEAEEKRSSLVSQRGSVYEQQEKLKMDMATGKYRNYEVQGYLVNQTQYAENLGKSYNSLATNINKDIAAVDKVIADNEKNLKSYFSSIESFQNRIDSFGNRFDTNDDLSGNNYLGEIAANTARTADAMDMSEEYLKSIRDLAEGDVIDRTTVASITVDMGGVSNTINSPMDLDGVVTYIADYVSEGLAVAVEGVH